METKYDTARNLLVETKILPAELQITRVSLNRFFNILQQTKNCSNKHFRILENVPIIANKRTHNLFLELKLSNGSIVRNFFRKWNTLPITIRKETSKTKFKCNGCGSIYVGQTSRHVTTRITEHQKKDSQVGHHLVECRGATNDIEWKILDACRTVEKLMIIEAIYISKLKPALNTRDECWGRELTLKY